jgi:NTP pyrophosphatase (non-canonical NTP hydrolase)
MTMTLHQLQKDVHQTAISKGWEADPSYAEAICLMHSELSEAIEAVRIGNPPDDKIPQFSSVEAELADVIIRILNLAEGKGLRVIEAMYAKAEYNKTRPAKHGGKAF